MQDPTMQKQGIIPQIVRSYSLGIVKQVVSGDTLIIRDRPVDGPPPERTIVLSNITCGRIGRKPTVGNPSGVLDDPYAWAAREFMRTALVGKEVCYSIENELQSGRKYGTVYEVRLVEEGLAEVRKLTSSASEKNQLYQQLLAAEEYAKSMGKGKWAESSTLGVRDVIWTIDDTRAFFEKYKHVPLKAIVEQVRDGSTLQLILLPDTLKEGLETYFNILLQMTGIKSPSIRYDDGKLVSEPLATIAQFFVESRILQREVTVLLESVVGQNFCGTVLHPNGNIAELLLRNGLAHCIGWNLSLLCTSGAAEYYKNAEKFAKEKHLRIWENYVATSLESQVQSQTPNAIIPGVKFSGKIMEVGNGDNVSVYCTDGVERKFFLSSIRPPRLINKDGEEGQRNRVRPLYDIPFLYEAREVLRDFVGQVANVTVDYIQPKTSTSISDRVCATIYVDDTNLALLLVSKGLASVIRYRNVNDLRSIHYGELLDEEEFATSKGLGMFSKQDAPTHRAVELIGNISKSRQFLGFFQRVENMDAVVEFVFNASRYRCYLTRETCVINLLLSGILSPRKGRTGTNEVDQPLSTEAYNFARNMCMQRNVEIKIESRDRVGNFVGWMFLTPSNLANQTTKSGGGKKKKKVESNVPKPKINLNVLLVSQGLATINHNPTMERSPYYSDMVKAEEEAKAEKRGLWSCEEWSSLLKNTELNGDEDYDDFCENGKTEYMDDFSSLSLDSSKKSNLIKESKLTWKSVQVTSISRPSGSQGFRFFAQNISDASTIVQISHILNNNSFPPLPPNYQPKKGDLCAACFSVDYCWYRARILRTSPKSVVLQFIDFGNEETINSSEYSSRISHILPNSLLTVPAQATEYRLAFVQLPADRADCVFAEEAFSKYVENKDVRIAVLFESTPCAKEALKPVPAVTMLLPNAANNLGPSSQSTDVDINALLLSDGLVFVEPLQQQLLRHLPQDLVCRYLDAQARAKKERKNLWRYGDFRVDTNEI